MKRKWIPGAILLLLAIAIGWMLRSETDAPPETSSADSNSSRSPALPAVSNDQGQFRTRSADRPPPQPKATHGPQQLQRFFLGELDFAGLTLPQALEKVREGYVQTCALTGEVPLKLKFTIPPGSYPRLDFKSDHSSVDTAVRFLAGIHGMMVKRHGSDYRFAIIESAPRDAVITAREVKKLRQLSDARDPSGPSGFRPSFTPVFSLERDLRIYLEDLGMKLDPSTRFTTEGRIVSDNARDYAALSALAAALRDLPQAPQHIFHGKVIELAPGAEWEMPELRYLTEGQLTLEMRKLAQIEGTNLQTLPAITARPGHAADIKIMRELVTPRGEEFDVNEIGHVVRLNAVPSGFGHQADLSFTHTTGELNPATLEAEIEQRTYLSDSSYSPDAAHRVLVQTRPDGSRTVMFARFQLVDPTGRPFAHPAE